MKLRISFAILFLVVSPVGGVTWHQIGSFASLATCQTAESNALNELELTPVWPDGFPAIVPVTKSKFENDLAQPISGSAPGACSVVGANIKSVNFFMDGTALVNGTSNKADTYWCNLDTTKFKDGRHTLAALVTFNDGTTEKLRKRYLVKNGTAPLPDDLPKAAVVHSGCVQKT